MNCHRRSLLPNNDEEWFWFWRGSIAAAAVLVFLWIMSVVLR